MNEEEIHIRLDTLLEQQQELLTLTRAIHTKLPSADEEIWLTPKQIMTELLFIEERTFYRRQAEGNWKRKKIGGKWYYLKSSVLGG